MAAHSSTLAWRIPGTEEPSGLQSMGAQRVRQDWAAGHKHTNARQAEQVWETAMPPSTE